MKYLIIFFSSIFLSLFFSVTGTAQYTFYPTSSLPVSLSTGSNWTSGGSVCTSSGTKAQISFNVSGINNLLTSSFALAQIRVTFSTSSPCGSNVRDLRLMIKYQPSGPCFIFYEGNPTPSISGSGASTLTNSTDVTMYLRDNPSCADLSWVDFDSNWDLDRTTSGNTGFFRAGCNNCGATQASTLTLAQAFNNINPNATWTIYAQYTGTAGNEPCITAANLIFGDPSVADSRNAGDNCSTAITYTGTALCAMTNTKTPSTNMPGSASTDGINNRNTFGTIGGTTCDWNAANNNDVWIKLTPGAGYFCINISGLSDQLQSIVVEPTNADNDGNPCTANAARNPNDQNWKVKSCPNPGAIYNGVTTGTLKNQQHCFTSEAGKTYYLVVDGNGGVESPFYVSGLFGTSQAALYETKLDFRGESVSSVNQLEWQYHDAPLIVKSFELERSRDGSHYVLLSQWPLFSAVDADKQFQYTDRYPAADNYYRLKVLHTDGSYYYSSVVQLKNFNKSTVTLFPNPVTDFLNVFSEKNIVSVNILNWQGQLVYSNRFSLPVRTITIPAQSWQKGHYVILLTDDRGSVDKLLFSR